MGPLELGKFYHVYNRGINGTDIFEENRNYEYFLRLYSKYIDPVAETYAWCLMKNHFHLFIRVRETRTAQNTNQNTENQKYSDITPELVSRSFSHLFNAYAQAFNKAYKRTGGLFETPFKRIEVTNTNYFKQLIFYIHNNPVKHGFTDSMIEYPWSSYLTIISVGINSPTSQRTIGWFNSVGEFQQYHQFTPNLDLSPEFLME
jgi:putative transposase